MNKTSGTFVVAAFAFVVGCSGGDGSVEVKAETAALTENGGDKLFALELTEAPTDGYALEGLVVKALPDGKEPITLACVASDVNTNQKLDKGDIVTCVEGATNQLGADLAGTDVDVELLALVDGKETLVAEATWTPTK